MEVRKACIRRPFAFTDRVWRFSEAGLHSVAVAAGARGDEVEAVARQLTLGSIDQKSAEVLLLALRGTVEPGERP